MRFPTRMVLMVSSIAMVAWAMGAAAWGKPSGVAPKVWMEQVCQSVEPVAEELVAKAEASEPAPPQVATVADIRRVAGLAGQTFDGLWRFVDAMRTAITDGELPAIGNAAVKVERMDEALATAQAVVMKGQTAIDAFEAKIDADFETAIEQLRSVELGDVDFDLGSGGSLAPRLERAFFWSESCTRVMVNLDKFIATSRANITGYA
ncbi:MAG: hypothetical protein WEG56_04380 [Chloroflexota bacterium]